MGGGHVNPNQRGWGKRSESTVPRRNLMNDGQFEGLLLRSVYHWSYGTRRAATRLFYDSSTEILRDRAEVPRDRERL